MMSDIEELMAKNTANVLDLAAKAMRGDIDQDKREKRLQDAMDYISDFRHHKARAAKFDRPLPDVGPEEPEFPEDKDESDE